MNFKLKEFDDASSTVSQLQEYSQKLTKESMKFDAMERKLRREVLELTKNSDNMKNEVSAQIFVKV